MFFKPPDPDSHKKEADPKPGVSGFVISSFFSGFESINLLNKMIVQIRHRKRPRRSFPDVDVLALPGPLPVDPAGG